MKKKLNIIVVTAAVVCLTFAGCAKKSSKTNSGATETTTETTTEATTEEVTEEPEANLDGGFDFSSATGSVTKEEKEIFEKALAELDGVIHEPLAVLGTQVVAGTNYAFLCKTTPVVPNATASLTVVTVYADLEGNVSLNDTVTIDIGALLEKESEDEGISGGYVIPEQAEEVALSDEAKKALEGALTNYTGVTMDVRAYLGNQVVAGTNYLFLCELTTVTAEPVSSLGFVTVYEDLEGNASIENILNIDATTFME